MISEKETFEIVQELEHQSVHCEKNAFILWDLWKGLITKPKPDNQSVVLVCTCIIRHVTICIGDKEY